VPRLLRPKHKPHAFVAWARPCLANPSGFWADQARNILKHKGEKVKRDPQRPLNRSWLTNLTGMGFRQSIDHALGGHCVN
jgi:hypothetical protein